MTVTPFRIAVDEAQLMDLRERLRRTRWPDEEPVDDWSQGVPLQYVQELCAYWADGYDWRTREARLNEFPQFRADIDGVEIHFLHVRSPHDDATPLLLTHGWPGSVVEFSKVIGPLSDPVAHGGEARDAFHVVAPSLPGYGFSGKPRVPGWGVDHVADAWAELMTELGYDRFVAQGGDWGAAVTTAIANRHPQRLHGIHLNMIVAFGTPEMMKDQTPQEREALAQTKHYNDWDSGYAKQQSTRPQTLGYGLADSPAGQLAWIVEKFWSWTDCDGHPENALSRDEMLDNVMLYWLTNSGASSARMYWESFSRLSSDPVDVPMGGSAFPKEIFRASRRWAETRYRNIVFWSEHDKGGHFAAFEQPAAFVDDLRRFARVLREGN